MRFYCIFRESSDPQMVRKGLERQWRQVRRFTETWPSGPNTIEHQVQVSESASRGCRAEWQEAVEQGIQLFRQGAIDAILFPEVDRETRNPVISIPILNLALSAGVPVFFAEEELHLDPGDPDAVNRYTEAMAKSCAYLATMVRKCRDGRFDRANSDHKLPSNGRMFGFDIVDGRRVPNLAQGEALRGAAQITLKEGRLAPAVKYLNENGFRTTYGKPFTTNTLRGLFRNRALVGETVIDFREKVVVLHHNPILDVAMFESLQALLDGRKLRAPRSEVFYALSGLVCCGKCGRKFESTKTGANRYYYRCTAHCGEKAWRKDELEWEVHEAFSRYLERRESQKECLELAQKSRAKLEEDRDQVARDLETNMREWKTLLEKDLAGYPDILISDKKRELMAERQSLEQRQARIEAELEALPSIDPAEVEMALSELAKPWQLANTGGYCVPSPMSWERGSAASAKWQPDTERKLTDEQARLLREMLLKLDCRITIRNRAVFISGKLPLVSSRVKQTAS